MSVSEVPAKTVAVVGEIFPVAEVSFLAFIESRLHQLEDTGEMQSIEKQMVLDASQHANRPNPVGLPRTDLSSTHYHTPSVVLSSPIYDQFNRVLIPQGTSVNALEQLPSYQPHWVFFNPMPIFHSLGLIAGIILPLTIGLRCFNYPSPLHVKQIPTLLKAIKASVFFSTDTFINQYVRNSDADCFSSLEFAVCGAEKVRDETHNLFVRQFGGLPLLEGYGVTETSPVISINKPDDNHPGTVGQLLPGMEARLEPVEGIENGGRLYVRGPNIMKGYIYEEDPGTIEAPAEGWHDTGDIVNIDDQGYIRILGRAKRFAKIAGEMVSLTTVEKLVEDLWPDNRHAVIAVSDDKKGERLILFTDNGTANLSHVAEFAKSEGIPPLAVPKTLFKLSEVPVLGSGKTDYVTLQRLAITG